MSRGSSTLAQLRTALLLTIGIVSSYIKPSQAKQHSINPIRPPSSAKQSRDKQRARQRQARERSDLAFFFVALPRGGRLLFLSLSSSPSLPVPSRRRRHVGYLCAPTFGRDSVPSRAEANGLGMSVVLVDAEIDDRRTLFHFQYRCCRCSRERRVVVACLFIARRILHRRPRRAISTLLRASRSCLVVDGVEISSQVG